MPTINITDVGKMKGLVSIAAPPTSLLDGVILHFFCLTPAEAAD
jgi:hypothetical protein